MHGRRLGKWIQERQNQALDYTDSPAPDEPAEPLEDDQALARMQRRQRIRWLLATIFALLLVTTGTYLIIRSATAYQRFIRNTFAKSISRIEYQPFPNSALVRVEDPALFAPIRDWLAESRPQDRSSGSLFPTPSCQMRIVFADGSSQLLLIDATGPSLGPSDAIVPPTNMVAIEVDGFKRWANARPFHDFIYSRLPSDRQLARSSLPALPAAAIAPGRVVTVAGMLPQRETSAYDTIIATVRQLSERESYGQAMLLLGEALRLMPESGEAQELGAITRSQLRYQAPRMRQRVAAVVNESAQLFPNRATYHQVRMELLKTAWMFPPDDPEMVPLRQRLASRRPPADVTQFREVWRLEGDVSDLHDLRTLLWSPDGTRIIAGDAKAFRIWDGATGRLLRRMPVASYPSMAFSADGRYLMGGQEGLYELSQAAQVWDLLTCEPATPQTDQPAALASFSHPDGVTAQGFEDGRVELRDSRTQKVLHTLFGHAGAVRIARFSADGDTLLTSGDDGAVIAWSDGPIDQTRPVDENPYRTMRRLATLPGRGIFAGNGQIILIPGKEEQSNGLRLPLMPVDLEETPRDLRLSPDGKLLFVITEAGDAVVIDVEKGTPRHRFSPPVAGSDIGFSPDGRRVACGGAADEVAIFEVGTGNAIRRLASTTGRLKWSTIRFSGDGRLVLARDGPACSVWEVAEVETGTNWFKTDRLASSEADAVPAILSPDGTKLAVARDGDVMEIINTDTFDTSVRVHRPGVATLAYSTDGRLIAAADAGGMITIHDGSSGNPLQSARVAGSSGLVRAMVFSPDGSVLLVDAADESMRLIDVTRGIELRRLALPEPSAGATMRKRPLSFSPDSRRVLTGSVLWGLE